MSEEIIDAEFEEVLPAVEQQGRTDHFYFNGEPRKNLPDGVYLGLDESHYFLLDRIGSTDLKILSTDDAESFWYGSKHNQDVEDTETDDERAAGKAIHAIVLEGVQAFEDRFIRIPDKYPDAKTGEPKNWNGNATYCRDWLKQAKESGLTPLSGKNYKACLQMGFVLMNHPTYGEWLNNGLSEVSVLFTLDGIPMRARFDKLLPFELVDVKSAGRHKTAMFVPPGISRDVWTCMRIIRDLGYSLQRHLYSKARHFMRDFVTNGQVYGGSDAERETLAEIAKEKSWRFVFLFLRKLSNTKKSPSAPVITPIVREPGDYTDEKGAKDLDHAIENYKAMMKTFGPDVPWARFNLPSMPEDTAFLDLFGRDPETPADPAVNEDGEWDAEENDDAA